MKGVDMAPWLDGDYFPAVRIDLEAKRKRVHVATTTDDPRELPAQVCDGKRHPMAEATPDELEPGPLCPACWVWLAGDLDAAIRSERDDRYEMEDKLEAAAGRVAELEAQLGTLAIHRDLTDDAG